MSRLSLLEAARSSGAAFAVVDPSEAWTFASLASRVRAVMGELLRRPNPSAPVPIVATLRLDTLLCFYAAIELGIPLMPIHPRLTSGERRALVPEGATLLDESWTAPLIEIGAPIDPPPMIDDEEPLAILHTSGSSGTPKGVVLSRRAFLASADASEANLGWMPDDRWLLCMPLAHVGGLSVVTRCLIARRAVALAAWTGNVERLRADMDATRATLVSFVPTMLRRILDEHPDNPVFSKAVRVVLLGGDATTPALREECARRQIPIATTYGMTETCSQIATSRPGEAPVGSGRMLEGNEVRIVDGEIQVRTPTAMSGYFPANRWPSRFDAERWLATGDLGSVDEAGNLHIHGRRSDLIITGGENVDPQEVESVLRRCEDILDVRAFGIADERWGQVVAIAVIARDHAAALQAIRQAASRDLAAHKRPRLIAFCAEFPQGPTGKADRRSIGRAVASGLVPVA